MRRSFSSFSWPRGVRPCYTFVSFLTIVFLCMLLVQPAITSKENEPSPEKLYSFSPQYQLADNDFTGNSSMLKQRKHHGSHERNRAESSLPSIKTQSMSTVEISSWVNGSCGLSDDAFISAIQRLEPMIPGELLMRALLAPITETGEGHLRNLALRIREFNDAFQLWESLHLSPCRDELRQQNVVERLRQVDGASVHLRETIASYDSLRIFINKFLALLFPWTMISWPDHVALHASFYRGGRGLVLTAGDAQAPFLLTSIPSFRRLGCDLPIEIMYLGDDDLGEDNREKLEQYPNVITRDLSTLIDDEGWTLKGWAAKPFAILMSSFREALFIDADALFFVNPQALFEDEQYTTTGALFFKDRNLNPESKRSWLRDILPPPFSSQVMKNRLWIGESGHMQDSGVVLIDKWRHFIPLLLTTRLNGPDRDGNTDTGKRGVYEMVYGDKETFWLSWEMAADSDYAFYDGETGTMGSLETKPEVPDELAESSHKFTESTQELASTTTTPESNSSVSHIPTAQETPEVRTDEHLSTLCSPQLLHFDRFGDPMWLNGWIAKYKPEHYSKAEFGSFNVYMKEPEEYNHTDTPWKIMERNIICLKGEYHESFTSEEVDFLEGVLDSARLVASDMS